MVSARNSSATRFRSGVLNALRSRGTRMASSITIPIVTYRTITQGGGRFSYPIVQKQPCSVVQICGGLIRLGTQRTALPSVPSAPESVARQCPPQGPNGPRDAMTIPYGRIESRRYPITVGRCQDQGREQFDGVACVARDLRQNFMLFEQWYGY